MKTTKLENDVQNFINALKAETNGTKRIKMCVDARLELEKAHTLNTVLSYLTTYRKEVQTVFGANSSLLKHLRPPKKEIVKERGKYRKEIQVRTETNELTTIPNYTELIEFAKGLLTCGSYLKVSLGLMLLTGRRSVEILKTGSFAKVRGGKNEVLFDGQAKKREQSQPYKIPTLCAPALVVDALEWLRREKGELLELTEKQLNAKCAAPLNTLSKCFLGWLGSGCTPHDLRKAYAAITYGTSNKKDSFRGFAAKVLGHSSENELTTETYFKYTI
jgi:hypothetical protein